MKSFWPDQETLSGVNGYLTRINAVVVVQTKDLIRKEF